MSTLRLGAAIDVREFQNLLDSLPTPQGHGLDSEALQDEFGRFRVWSGNLGVLQKGHSSLDYRLRDAPLLSNEVSKLLKELEQNLQAAREIVTGVRLPYEQQSASSGSDDEDESSFFSEEEDDEGDAGAPRTELSMRFGEITDIIDNLYKISVRIRAPTVRTRSLKAASYRPKDPDTGIDLFDQYTIFDFQHTQELIEHLRQAHTPTGGLTAEDEILVKRLARAVTLRRRQFKYWRRHRDKLGMSTVEEEPQMPATIHRPAAHRHDTLEAQPATPGIDVLPEITPSQKTGKTLLSGTEATQHHQSLDDIVDSKSVTSYAVTVKDLSGKGIDLPPPPKTAEADRDFECPYCFIICPARYGRGRPWRTHVLQDLQPYVCTYPDCEASNQLFRSRRDWIEHEGSHRKAWRCPEHPNAVYASHLSLEEHLRKYHADKIPDEQISNIAKVGETSTIDLRQQCPICCAKVDQEGMGTLQNHIANHLERIAAFSLPVDFDDDSDGGSSRASRGGTENSRTSSASRISTESNYSGCSGEEAARRQSLQDTHEVTSISPMRQPSQERTDPGRPLSESLIRGLPDDSGQRLDLLFTSQKELVDDEKSAHDGSNEAGSTLEPHMAETEPFRSYVLTLPGAQSIRRYGPRSGRIFFEDGASAAKAMQTFDRARFPNIWLRQKDDEEAIITFSVGDIESMIRNIDLYANGPGADGLYHCPREGESGCNHQPTTIRSTYDLYVASHLEGFSSRPASPTAQMETSNRVSPRLNQPPIPGDAGEPSPILLGTNIPSIRDLYRSGVLISRDDRRYAPNDRFNEIISFCRYDITRLEVSAIVNSASEAVVPSGARWNLESIVHRAAGPELLEECKKLEWLKVSHSVLTAGYQLPCSHIIHVATPLYAGSTVMRQYDLLTESYRSALTLAMQKGLKTLAFCCLGTGNLGFPSRTAAQIAIQEVREFLEAHPAHGFERIIFCVYSANDAAAYAHFLPSFFPAPYENSETYAPGKVSRDVDILDAQLQRTHTRVNEVIQEFRAFSLRPKDVSQHVARNLSDIAIFLDHFQKLGPESKFTFILLGFQHYIKTFVLAMITFCSSMMQMLRTAKASEHIDSDRQMAIWNDYNNHMKIYQGLTLVELTEICKDFAQHMSGALEHKGNIPPGMKSIDLRLADWLAKQPVDETQSAQVPSELEDTMLTRDYQQEAPNMAPANTLKLDQIPSLAQLYEESALQPKTTQAAPSTRSNDIVCLAREDITKLEVDILVNSTDETFSSTGNLDRAVFQAGGHNLQKECADHSPCNEGEVILTGGHTLPVKHVLHAIPPQIYSTDTLDVLRDMYRKILHMASYLKATSIAIPSLGTGMLGYPRRDSAGVALSEVKRFLESIDESSPIEKIIFVVFSSNDEFVYKSLLPTYFPPPSSMTAASEDLASSPMPTPERSRTLLGSLGDAFRRLAPGKQPASNTRPLEPSEENALIGFETHAQGCSTCSKISEVYLEGGDLCEDGYRLATQVLRLLHMKADHSVHSHQSVEDFAQEVEVPDIFPLSLELLQTVEKSFRDPDRDRPFVSTQPSLGLHRRNPYSVWKMDIAVSDSNYFREFDQIHIWTDQWTGWKNLEAFLTAPRLIPGALWLPTGVENTFRVDLHPKSIKKQSDTEIVIGDLEEEEEMFADRFTLTLQSPKDCDKLFDKLKQAASHNRMSAKQPLKLYARTFIWVDALQVWEAFAPRKPGASLSFEPGSLRISSVNETQLRFTPTSIVKKISRSGILLDRVTIDGPGERESQKWRRVIFKCDLWSERDLLLAKLRDAADPLRLTATSWETIEDIEEDPIVDLDILDQLAQRNQPLSEQAKAEWHLELPGRPSATEDTAQRSDESGTDETLRTLPEGPKINSPHQQPDYNERAPFEGDNHRSILAQYNNPPHNPSRPPLSAFHTPPRLHPTTGNTSVSLPLSADASQSSAQTMPPTSPNPTSKDPSTRLIDPKLIPEDELDIESYFEYATAPIFFRGISSPDGSSKTTGTSREHKKLRRKFTVPFEFDEQVVHTRIDKRLVYRDVLEKAGLEVSEEDEEWFYVFKMVGEEELVRLHRETRSTPRFTVYAAGV